MPTKTLGPEANKDAGPRRGVDWGVPHRLKKGTSVAEGGWIVRPHFDWGGEQNIGCGNLSLAKSFKNFDGKLEWKNPKRAISPRIRELARFLLVLLPSFNYMVKLF